MLTRLVIIRGSFGFYNARPKPLHYTCTASIKVERIIIGGNLPGFCSKGTDKAIVVFLIQWFKDDG